MIFIDSDIPMYLVGAAHPNKIAAQRALERCIAGNERMVTSAEVVQEILNRYAAIKRLDAVEPTLRALLAIVDEVYSIELADVERAKDVLLGRVPLSARDALHVAVMKRHDIERILSFDAGFDALSWIQRVS